MSSLRSPADQAARVRNVRRRITDTNAADFMPRCMVPLPPSWRGCGRPTARAAKQGLSAFYCRRCILHRARHGSHWCKSIGASELRPYLRAACSYIDLHRHRDPFIIAALQGITMLLANVGPAELVTRLRGKSAKARALQCFARMRDKAIPPQRVLAVVLAIHALLEAEAARFHRTNEYRLTQVGKAMFRRAGGSHKVWQAKDDAGNVIQRTEMHVHPRSTGRVLRSLGAMIEAETELALEKHREPVIAMKVARYGPRPDAPVHVSGVAEIPT